MNSKLFIVPTPIGHLADISERALEVLRMVDFIAAEDTRHSKKLLNHHHITTPMVAYHAHNEVQKTQDLIEQLSQGKSIALISDAGTPLISDPGYELVSKLFLPEAFQDVMQRSNSRAAQHTKQDGISQANEHRSLKGNGYQTNIAVVPIPGPCAFITALSASGLPVEPLTFIGFLPTKSSTRRRTLMRNQKEGVTVVAYESPNRIVACLEDIKEMFDPCVQVVVARELTKQYETFYRGTPDSVFEQLKQSSSHQKGEFVLMFRHPKKSLDQEVCSLTVYELLEVLTEELSLPQSVRIASKFTSLKRQALYSLAEKARGHLPS